MLTSSLVEMEPDWFSSNSLSKSTTSTGELNYSEDFLTTRSETFCAEDTSSSTPAWLNHSALQSLKLPAVASLSSQQMLEESQRSYHHTWHTWLILTKNPFWDKSEKLWWMWKQPKQIISTMKLQASTAGDKSLRELREFMTTQWQSQFQMLCQDWRQLFLGDQLLVYGLYSTLLLRA